MTAGNKILRSLQDQKEQERQLSLDFAKSAARNLVANCQDRGVHVSVRVSDVDRLGILLAHMKLACDGSVSPSVERFERRISRLTGPIDGIEGEFQLVESDAASLYAMLRTTPLGRPDARFFEIVVNKREATVDCYSVNGVTWKRDTAVANLGIDAFVSIVDGIVERYGRD